MPLTVLLDVDGTLVDNSYIHTMAWWHACRDHGIDAPMAVIHRLIGMGGDQLVPALVGRDMPELEEAHSRHYRERIAEVPALPGAVELLAELHRRDAVIALATSSKAADLRVILERLPTSTLVDRVVTSEDVSASKPAPDLVAVALAVTGADPASAAFIGDTGWDVEAAGRVGIPCVAVRTGGWAESELRDAGAVEVHDSCAALLAAFDSSIIGSRLAALRV